MQEVPCTVDGCTTVKFFAGKCNPCQKAWEVEHPAALAPVVLTTWDEECIAKVMSNG